MRTKRKTTPIGRVEQFVKQGGLQKYAETNYEELFNENSSDENFIFALYSAATANLRGIYWEPIEKEWLILDYREIPGSQGQYLRTRLLSFGFQSLKIQPPGWIEEIFHPDFNFKFPSWMARLIRRTSTIQQELTFINYINKLVLVNDQQVDIAIETICIKMFKVHPRNLQILTREKKQKNLILYKNTSFDHCQEYNKYMNEELVGRLEEKLYFNDSTKPEHSTKTTKSQLETQQKYCERIQYFVDNAEILKVQLDKEKHIKYCIKGLESLSSSYEGLDSSRPWLVYWTVHALDLLDYHFDTSLKSKIVNFLALCQNKDGGFGGGPGQISHLATSYAAMNAIAIMGADGFSDAYSIVNKEAMKSFLMRVKSDTGCFQMHVNGEEDTRAAYCACSIAAMLKFDIKSELFNNTVNYLVSCQNWDGGFGPNPGAESHGGYTFTSLAALTILNGLGDIRDSDSLVRWLCNRQMTVEGGFSGRANKLVDSCYNFWQGGSFPIIQNLLDPVYKDKNHWICDEKSLHEYTLFGSQWRDQTGYRGGFGDRPGAHRDYYHTCYALSGLAAMSYVYDDSGNLVKHDIGQEQSVALLNSIHNVRPVAVLDIYDFFTTH